jgi:glycosyltransferase involved in cell wall biosynthesis
MQGLTLVTFTRNSEEDIKRLLGSLHRYVDEIIVIDSGSKDATVNIAKYYGAKVFSFKPLGFVEPYRVIALKLASYEWILLLDVDEIPSRMLKEHLKDLINTYGDKYVAFNILRVNVNNKGKFLTTFYPHKEIRLFKKSTVLLTGKIFEQPKVRGLVMDLPESYFIIHLLKHRVWISSIRKAVKYAQIVVNQYPQFYEFRSILGKVLNRLSPLTLIPLYFYHLIILVKDKKVKNIDTLIATFFDVTLLQSIIMFLYNIKKIRSLLERVGAKSSYHYYR